MVHKIAMIMLFTIGVNRFKIIKAFVGQRLPWMIHPNVFKFGCMPGR